MEFTTLFHGRYQFFPTDFVTLFTFSAHPSFLSCLEWLSGKYLSVMRDQRYAPLHCVTLRFKLMPDRLIFSFSSLGLYFFYAIAKVYRRMINGLREELSMVCMLQLEVNLASFPGLKSRYKP